MYIPEVGPLPGAVILTLIRKGVIYKIASQTSGEFIREQDGLGITAASSVIVFGT